MAKTAKPKLLSWLPSLLGDKASVELELELGLAGGELELAGEPVVAADPDLDFVVEAEDPASH